MKLVLTREETSAMLLKYYPAEPGYTITDVTIKPYSDGEFCSVEMIRQPPADIISITSGGEAA